MSQDEQPKPSPPRSRGESEKVGCRLSLEKSRMVKELREVFPHSSNASIIEASVEHYYDHFKNNGGTGGVKASPKPASPPATGQSADMKPGKPSLAR